VAVILNPALPEQGARVVVAMVAMPLPVLPALLILAVVQVVVELTQVFLPMVLTAARAS
jgi:hypothetical protein